MGDIPNSINYTIINTVNRLGALQFPDLKPKSFSARKVGRQNQQTQFHKVELVKGQEKLRE